MSEGFFVVVAVAFAAQLAVLPGEKVQFIIAGLSTRYHPLLVVAAAGTAFAGWTAVEIHVGGVLLEAVPGLYLDALTAGLFLAFAGLLLRSAPANDDSITDAAESMPAHETDGGTPLASPLVSISEQRAEERETLQVTIRGREVPEYAGGFLPIFALMAAGEFGDKTQLVTISLAAQYGAHPGIWLGELLAIIPVSLVNAYVCHRYAHRIDRRKVHVAAASIFVFFALDAGLHVTLGWSLWDTGIDLLRTAVAG